MDSIVNTPTDERHRDMQDGTAEMHERHQRFYDTLQARSDKKAVPRFLYSIIVTRHKRDTTRDGRFIDEARSIRPYAGKPIGNITVIRNEIFDQDGNWLERTANNIHVVTLSKTIKNDLLFKTGDPIDPNQLVKNSQLIRGRRYISDLRMELTPSDADTTSVDITLYTRDSWTISADASFHSDGESMIELFDANILGTGNKLSVKTYFDWKEWDYGGNILEFDSPNILGSFFEGNLQLGNGYDKKIMSGRLSKDFVYTTDYTLGGSYVDEKKKRYRMLYNDSLEVVASRSWDFWSGRSRLIKPIRGSIYVTGRYWRQDFYRRPEVSADFNPAFHDTDNMLYSVGLYREKFYTTSLIYGFGYKEYLASGYRVELTGGYTWGEFRNDWYMGASYKFGGFSKIGYFMGGVSIGSYRNLPRGEWWRSAIDADLRWFSNLFIFGKKSRMRQFLMINYTKGWNRSEGNNEILQFNREHSPRSLYGQRAKGTDRIVLNTETVLFTPLSPIGFRVAFFGFADFGLIGYDNNVFKNDFYSSFGLGIRLRNERLVFSTIQFRLGVAFGPHGLIKNEYASLSNEQRLYQYRFIPEKPQPVGYR